MRAFSFARRARVLIVFSSRVRSLGAMRVLVVEDEARMARLLRRALEEEGHAVDTAGDGPEGLWLAT